MRKPLFALLSALLLTAVAGATVVTSLPGGTVVPMPAINYFGPGPQTFGPGITWSSTNAVNQGGSVLVTTAAMDMAQTAVGMALLVPWLASTTPLTSTVFATP